MQITVEITQTHTHTHAYIYISWHCFRNVLYLTLMVPVSQQQEYVKGITVFQKSEELCFGCDVKISILYSKKENPKQAVTNCPHRIFNTGMIYLKLILLHSVQKVRRNMEKFSHVTVASN